MVAVASRRWRLVVVVAVIGIVEAAAAVVLESALYRRFSNDKNYMLNKPNFPALRAPVRWRRRCDCPAIPCQR